MKKRFSVILSFVLIFAMLLALPSCGGKPQNSVGGNTEISDLDESVNITDVIDKESDSGTDKPDGEITDDGDIDEDITDDGDIDNGDTDEENTDEGNTDEGNTDNGDTDNDNTDNDNTDGDNNDDENTADKDEEIVINSAPVRNGSKVAFGYYPQSTVTDSDLIDTLNGKANPWTSSNEMWYSDVVSGNAKYRGVKTDENGTASWFKYEPISWTVLEDKNETLLILCDMIIDARSYAPASNNYKDSAIRAWLNNEFINTAFDELAQKFILTTEVDNSSKTVADYSGNQPFLCENTFDKIFLLAKSEAKSTSYGFENESSRKKTATEYAKANGVFANENNGGWWWLRTPTYDSARPDKSDLAHNIKVSGAMHSSNVYLTTGGVVPAMWITLEADEDIQGDDTPDNIPEDNTDNEDVGEDNGGNENIGGDNNGNTENNGNNDNTDDNNNNDNTNNNDNNENTDNNESQSCSHSGGTATCKALAVCDSCGESYGTLNANNHTWSNGVCSECGYECAHESNEGHNCAICKMAIGHVYKNGECLGCGLTKSGNKIIFGSYPQSKVTDSSLVSTLNAKAGAWTEDNGVYYFDVESGNEKYRGVKSENGAASWFKYEPISWTILEQSDGKALILCDMIIDAHRYDDDKNNYADSEIRAWLNGNFIDTAFGELQKEVILVTEVDNSSKTVADYSGNHPYLCENTNDKVFLLAKSDIKNADYGFNGEADRKKTATAYAIANGAYVDSNGGAWWWLRTPTYDYTRPDKSDLAHNIKVSGAIHSSNVYLTTGGVVPAMWITL